MIGFRKYRLIQATPNMLHFEYNGEYFRILRANGGDYQLWSVTEKNHDIEYILDFNYHDLMRDYNNIDAPSNDEMLKMVAVFIQHGFILEKPRQTSVEFYMGCEGVYSLNMLGNVLLFDFRKFRTEDPISEFISNVYRKYNEMEYNGVTKQMLSLYTLTAFQMKLENEFEDGFSKNRLESEINGIERKLGGFTLREKKINGSIHYNLHINNLK